MSRGLIRSLEAEKAPTRTSPTWHEVEAVVSSIGPSGSGFVILAIEGVGFVQAAGAQLRLTVEFREELGSGGFRHSVLGKPGSQTKETSINTAAGTIRVLSNEVLAVRDALDIFRSFFDTATVPSHYTFRDTTEMFKV